MRRKLLFILFVISFTSSKAQLISETVIGYTMYDVQCNRSTYNRIVQNPDGTVAAVWNFSPDSTVGMPQRGTGYNYYNGSSWGPWPTTRTETNRTGFTNIINTASGKELSVHHSGTNISVNYRPAKGTGTWSYSEPWGSAYEDTWAKAASSGDSVYAIWNGLGVTGQSVAGQTGPIYFSASYDGGQTWTPKAIIPLLDSSHYTGWAAECYAIDAKGGTVAISYGELRTDLGILKSSDGGQTWTQIIVNTHPIPNYPDYYTPTDTNLDGLIDTIITPSGDQTILVDHNGVCHVWFSEFRWYTDGISGSFAVISSPDGLQYWNESMGSDNFIKIATMQDFNSNGRIDFPFNAPFCPGYNEGGSYLPMTGKPSAGIDQNGTIYLVYQTVDETSDTTRWSTLHTHSYIKTLPQIAGSYDVNNWTYPFSISRSIAQGGNDEFQECVFPSITKYVDQYAYVVYQRDLIPGVRTLSCPARDSMDSYTNEIVVAKIEAATVGIKPVKGSGALGLSVSPNPAKQSVMVEFNVDEISEVEINLTDLTGKKILIANKNKFAAGKNRQEFILNNISPGIYICTIQSNNLKASCKVVIVP